jgi:pyruvate/2-oxoglutarate dehydrogenase complex dihydrolipoamide dehydrogenase (E3) component
MRANVPHIFAIGDIVGQPMLAHQAQVVAGVIAGELQGNTELAEKRKSPASTPVSSPAWSTPTAKWAACVSPKTLALRPRH